MNYINLTPHIVDVYDSSGKHVLSVPPSGTVARVATKRRIIRVTDDGVEIYATKYGSCAEIKKADPGTAYIVSGKVKASYRNRGDVLSPGVLIRNSDGDVTGCVGLVALASG